MLAAFLLGIFLPGYSLAKEQIAQSYIVKLNNNQPEILKQYGEFKQLFTFTSSLAFANIYELKSNFSLADLQDELRGQTDYIEINKNFAVSEGSVLGTSITGVSSQPLTVNDPGFTSNYLNIDKQWGLPAAGFDYAWTKTTGTAMNVVAVIDTGVDATHQDLRSLALIDGYDFVGGKAIEGRINSDDNGHGTLVAGILGASANNGIGVVGTNWSIAIMPLKALDSAGKGDSSSVSQSIVWAADHGANFINLSLGGIGFGHDVALSNAVSYAFNKGLVIVAAAGNDTSATGDDIDKQPVYPVCDDNGNNQIIGVAATDQNDLKPDFSNYGSICVDVTAPGKRILSTINYDPITHAKAPNSYAYASGTSLGVPFVIGEAALLRSLYPQISNVQIRDQILSTADSLDNANLSQCGGHSCRGLLGAGRINARRALEKPLSTAMVMDGDLISLGQNQQAYQLVGNQKRPVSVYVQNQRFPGVVPKIATQAQLDSYQIGPNVTPLDGTVVKTPSSPAVYMVKRGQKLPITSQVFKQRKLNASQIVELPDSEVNSWLTGNFLVPSEGTVVKAYNKKTIYWVVGETLHPVNSNFYNQLGLKIFPTFYVTSKDLVSFPIGEAYIR